MKFEGINSALRGMSKHLLEEGEWRETRGFKCLELPYPVTITIKNPSARHILIPERKWNWSLPFAESIWLALGWSNLDDLTGYYVKNLYTYSDDGKTWRGCFSGDTKVRLLSGESKSFEELENEKEFWVYSKDKQGRIVPGRAHSVHVTKETKNLWHLVLDNGESIFCTPDHQFRLKDGSYEEAQYLLDTDSLSPLYTREAQTWGYRGDGYEEVQDDDGNWVLTHRRIGEFLENSLLKKDRPCIHHKDQNKKNNSPFNLEWLTEKDHRRAHAYLMRQEAALKRKNDPLEKQRQDIISIKNLKLATKAQKELLKTSEGDYLREIRKQNILKINKNPKVKKKMLEGRMLRVLEKIEQAGEVPSKDTYSIYKNPKAGVPNWDSFIQYFGSLEQALLIKNERYNHKIVFSQKITLKKPIKVYDLSVDQYHNFALDCGVFVHNSYGPRFRYYSPSKEQHNIGKYFSNRDLNSIDQFWYIVKAFERDENTRQAIITISDPNKDSFDKNYNLLQTKDYPCTRELHFMKSTKGKLDLITQMRSNDLIFGFSAINIFNFTYMQEYFSYMLGLPIGTYYHKVDNFHVYEDFVDKIKEFANLSKDQVEEMDQSQVLYNRPDSFSLKRFDEVIDYVEEGEKLARAGDYTFLDSNIPDLFKDTLLTFIYKNAIMRNEKSKVESLKFINPILNKIIRGK